MQVTTEGSEGSFGARFYHDNGIVNRAAGFQINGKQ